MKTGRFNLTKDQLYTKYINEKKSCETIGKEIGCCNTTVHSWLVKYNIPRRKYTEAPNSINMTGIKVGNLLVIQQAPRKKNRQSFWIVQCQQCKVKFEIAGWKLRHKQTGGCSYCGKHPNFRGYGDIYGNYWNNLKRSAIARNLKFNITIEYIWKLYIKQKGICALSGLPIIFERTNGKLSEKTASLDRIDNTKGYIKGNLQWVHKNINRLKNTFSDKKLIELCTLIAQYRKNK